MLEKKELPPLSQSEQEHLTYLRVYELYNEAKQKRRSRQRYGSLFIIISGLVFLALMFSLESKIELLCLWIVTIIYCVVIMIRADYQYNLYKEMLGICDEFDKSEMEDIEEDTKPPETVSVNDPKTIQKGDLKDEQYHQNISQ